jgi:hypothetical protein
VPSGWRGSTWTRGTDVAWTGSKVNIARTWEVEIDRRRDRGCGEAGAGPMEGTPPARAPEGIVSGCPAE